MTNTRAAATRSARPAATDWTKPATTASTTVEHINRPRHENKITGGWVFPPDLSHELRHTSAVVAVVMTRAKQCVPLVLDLDASRLTAHSEKELAAPTYRPGFGFSAHGKHGWTMVRVARRTRRDTAPQGQRRSTPPLITSRSPSSVAATAVHRPG